MRTTLRVQEDGKRQVSWEEVREQVSTKRYAIIDIARAVHDGRATSTVEAHAYAHRFSHVGEGGALTYA